MVRARRNRENTQNNRVGQGEQHRNESIAGHFIIETFLPGFTFSNFTSSGYVFDNGTANNTQAQGNSGNGPADTHNNSANTYPRTFFFVMPLVSRQTINSRNLNMPLTSILESDDFREAIVAAVDRLMSAQAQYVNRQHKQRIKNYFRDNKPYIFTKSMEQKDCCICLNNLKENQLCRRLGCEHDYHRKCIDKWLFKGNSYCPMCRKGVFDDEKK